MNRGRLLALLPILLVMVACNSGGPTAQASPSSSPSPSPSAQGWPTTGTLAVYDGPSADRSSHTVWVVGFSGSAPNATANVITTVKLASRADIPLKCIGCFALDPPYVSTSKTQIYVLDGNSTVSTLAPDGSLKKVTAIPGTDNARAAFAVSPDDSQIAVGVMDFASGKFSVYVENLHGGGHVDVFGGAAPFYWPIRWRNGKIVLASGPNTQTFMNPYHATGYALIDPTAGAQPVALGRGDCIPSGTLTPAGTACIVRPGTQCIEGLVANATSPYYYNSCLRRVNWDGTETAYLISNTSYMSTFTVSYAALSPNTLEITTDQLGRLAPPVSATHGGNNFLGLGPAAIRPPVRPCMGWIDGVTFSFTFVNPDGSSDVRIIGATFAGSTEIAPGVPSSPINGDLVATVPDEFDT
jgi:hypothetical protein